MCKAVSGITKSDGTIYMPEPEVWDHSHTSIAKRHGIPDGMFGDKYARWEITPKDDNYQSDPETWVFRLDEKREPGWWADDAPALRAAAYAATIRYMDAANKCGSSPKSSVSATGDRGTASATGDLGTASATGNLGTASATGDRGTASATGDRGTASATGYRGTASATGNRGTASATGYLGTASATGYLGTASATGDRGTASATGCQGTASATGYLGTASATGYLGTASATGYLGTASATGDRGTASATGCESPSIAVGYNGYVRTGERGALVCAERSDDWKLIGWVFGVAGENGIKPNVWYQARGGKLVEADDDVTREADRRIAELAGKMKEEAA